jgi:hypothetical protein
MPLPKLDLAPEKARYGAQAGAAVARQPVLGGHARTRLDQLGAPLAVKASWMLNRAEFAYLGAFYRQLIDHGSAPFLIDLLAGQAVPIECEAKFVPGSFSLNGVSGETHSCDASLEVVAPARDAGADAALVSARAAPIGGLPVMALTPSTSGYSVSRGDTVLSARPGMGPSAQRLDYFNTPSTLAVHWNVGPADFNYLCAFYWTAIREGALPFLIEAVLDHPDPRQLAAKMIPGSFALSGLSGMTYSVDAQVDVVPILSADYDAEVLMLWDELGADWEDWMIDLARLVNVEMPRWD